MKSLSPWNRANEREVYVQGRRNYAYDISGVNILDYLDLYRKLTYSNQESYRLDHIAFVELGQRKVNHDEYENFKDFYTSDWQKFMEYNIQDVELIDRLEDKMKLLELAITMSYDAKANFEDVYSQVRMWDTMIYNYLTDRNVVVPPRKGAKKDEKYAGAYVKEPKPGCYDWVVSFDLNSLYPHLIMQYNISPETLRETRHPSASVEGILKKEIDIDGEFAVCANGAQYRKDVQGFLPLMMQKMYDSRVIFKKKMIEAKKQYEKTPTVELMKEIARCNNIQMAKKISLNSAYGAIGNEHFRYYRLANAEAITLSGQVSIRWIENKMNQYLNKLLSTDKVDYVIASDTDSIYLNLGPVVDKFLASKSGDKAAIVGLLDKICKEKLEPFIESSYQELATYVSAYDQKMIMKRENIADRGIWTAKKRYILNVWDSEGVRYKEPKMKIMGLETARSSTPQYFRDKLYAAFKIVISNTNDELITFINKVRNETRTQGQEGVAFPRGVNNLEKYRHPNEIYTKGTPIHVRGALLYNHFVRTNKLEHKYPYIQEGEKIKFIYLKTPNPLHENCISFFSTIPPELNLENVLQCVGWTHEKKVTLGSFFE
jgi:DNA polymerase elongation subunit (family B)